MPQTPIQPATAMTNARSGAAPAIYPLLWKLLPGSAVSTTVGSDGSLWALSTAPAGPDKAIWHFKNGTWTNIPGSASQIAAGPAGMLYAVNSSGHNVYAYDGSSWRSLGGGARSVTAGADGSVYVISNSGAVGSDSAIWKYTGGVWTQQPGSGAQIVGSLDPKTYSVPGIGTIVPNGYFVISSAGAVSYFSPGIGYIRIAAPHILRLASVPGGIIAVTDTPEESGSPGPNGDPLYHFDYAKAVGGDVPGAGIAIATGPLSDGVATQVYVANAFGQIWTTPYKIPPTLPMQEYRVPTASSNPQAITAGADRALWFTETGANKIGRITTAGSITEFAIPKAASGPLGIAAGPDGALWFTESETGTIGRITTAGKISEYTIPTPKSFPTSIVAGPDGALWFTEFQASQIGRISVNGQITEFSAAFPQYEPGSAAPGDITAGPDGAMWFTAGGAPGATGRITVAGKVSGPFGPLGTIGSIAAGTDGYLWLSETNFLEKLTTGGKVAGTYHIEPEVLQQPDARAIVAGPDRAMWFTDASGYIGRVTGTGTITEYPTPPSNDPFGSQPSGITAGPDGALWFTESYGNAIGRVVPAGK